MKSKKKNRFARSIQKYIRKEKARFHREGLSKEDYLKQVRGMYKRVSS